jgi:hypothetical protein
MTSKMVKIWEKNRKGKKCGKKYIKSIKFEHINWDITKYI